MKIAIVSDDGQTISKHFGRAGEYVVFSVEQEKIVDRKSLPKEDFCHSSHRRQGRHQHRSDPRGKGFGNRSAGTHLQMFEAIKDCDVVLSRGMGRGAYLDLQSLGIRPIVTDIANIDMAVQAVLDDTVIDHVENLH
jgi:predicted Fe-Mo cluster-binding NifX family protein